MFSRIEGFLLSLFTDLQNTLFWIFAFGALFSAVMIGLGSEENAPKFKKGLLFCIIGAVIFLLAKPLVEYIRGNL